jgi:hypothetical protein
MHGVLVTVSQVRTPTTGRIATAWSARKRVETFSRVAAILCVLPGAKGVRGSMIITRELSLLEGGRRADAPVASADADAADAADAADEDAVASPLAESFLRWAANAPRNVCVR